MRYHYETNNSLVTRYGHTYRCDHPLYSACTLYKEGDKGLAVVQKRYNPRLKVFLWGPIDPWLVDNIFSIGSFHEYFDKHCAECKDGLYPTVSVRQIMWALRMKPLKKEWWESQEKQLV